MIYINLYLANRAYGGPEEGGWYYDCGEAVCSFPVVTRRRAERISRLVERIAAARNKNAGYRADMNSMLCEGRHIVFIEEMPAAAYPAETPHYE